MTSINKNNEQGDSWINIDANSDFTLQNIPFGVCSKVPTAHNKGSVVNPSDLRPRCCTAIGEYAVDLSVLAEAGVFGQTEQECAAFGFRAVHAFSQPTLNSFMSYERPVWVAVRKRIQQLFKLDGGSDDLRLNEQLKRKALWKLSGDENYFVETHLPAKIGDYTDFYSSRNHATNVGIMFRGKENALQPNWLHLPVGYHGRASSVIVSSQDKSKNVVRRPCGQLQKDNNDPSQGSVFGPCKLMDFELEVAFFIGGSSNELGKPLAINEAEDRIFGYVLMNDWSARDIQKWEYVPLGPFGAKNFATTISPWIVTPMALEPFQCTPLGRQHNDPVPLEYLHDPEYEKSGAYDIELFVRIQPEGSASPEEVCHSNYKHMYWTPRQQLVHHAITGCNMNPGDLLGSGTISGTEESSFGSMLELCWKGTKDVKLGDTGEVRKFLKDGDTISIVGFCEKEGVPRVGFGQCVGKILPAQNNTARNYGTASDKLIRFINIKLHNYWRSSSSWRVRIALAAKNLQYEYCAVNLLKEDNKGAKHTKLNPRGQVPVLECTDSHTGKQIIVTQSLAIIEFLEMAYADQGGTLYPTDIATRAMAFEIAEVINSGIQPLQNMAHVAQMEQLSKGTIKSSDLSKEVVSKGLHALEKLVCDRVPRQNENTLGPFVCGTFAPTVADACLIPQLYNAQRFGVDLATTCPNLLEAKQACLKHPWFVVSLPEAQIDAL